MALIAIINKINILKKNKSYIINVKNSIIKKN